MRDFDKQMEMGLYHSDEGDVSVDASQIPVGSWYDMFSDHTYAEASLARVLSESYRLEMNGKNMRNLEPINNRKNG